MCDSTNSSWTSWGLGLVKTSVAWSWRKVISSLTEVEKGTINYVVPKVLEVCNSFPLLYILINFFAKITCFLLKSLFYYRREVIVS